MKKAILLLMLLLPMGVGLQSCSSDDGEDPVAAYYAEVLESKIQMLNEFKAMYEGLPVIITEGENEYPLSVNAEELEVVDGRYIETEYSTFDLMYLVGYKHYLNLYEEGEKGMLIFGMGGVPAPPGSDSGS